MSNLKYLYSSGSQLCRFGSCHNSRLNYTPPFLKLLGFEEPTGVLANFNVADEERSVLSFCVVLESI